MVSKTMMEKFMRMEKVERPDEWIKNCGFVINVINDTKEITGKESILINYNSCCFYDLYDKYDENTDFKIYPILNKKFWVVEKR